MKFDAPIHSPDRQSGGPQRSFVITPDRGADWLRLLFELVGADQSPAALSRLRDTLADACWLARWSRDYVTLELPINELPEIVRALVDVTERQRDGAAASLATEIVGCLSVR